MVRIVSIFWKYQIIENFELKVKSAAPNYAESLLGNWMSMGQIKGTSQAYGVGFLEE
jgi:hypothetical protein